MSDTMNVLTGVNGCDGASVGSLFETFTDAALAESSHVFPSVSLSEYITVNTTCTQSFNTLTH